MQPLSVRQRRTEQRDCFARIQGGPGAQKTRNATGAEGRRLFVRIRTKRRTVARLRCAPHRRTQSVAAGLNAPV